MSTHRCYLRNWIFSEIEIQNGEYPMKNIMANSINQKGGGHPLQNVNLAQPDDITDWLESQLGEFATFWCKFMLNMTNVSRRGKKKT